MTADRYTKTILTIIAGSLLFLCFILAPKISEVHAQTDRARPQDVRIVGIDSSTNLPVRITGIADGTLIPVRIDGSKANLIIPVGIAGGRGPIPVSLQSANELVTVGIGIRGVRYNDVYHRWEWVPIPVKQVP